LADPMGQISRGNREERDEKGVTPWWGVCGGGLGLGCGSRAKRGKGKTGALGGGEHEASADRVRLGGRHAGSEKKDGVEKEPRQGETKTSWGRPWWGEARKGEKRKM